MRNRLSGFRSLAIGLGILAAACASPGDHGANHPSLATDLASRVKAGDGAALATLRAGAMAGDAKSQYQLGLAYAEGWTGGQDLSQAVAWWRSAAQQGDADALNVMAYIHDQGIEVPRNRALALKYWQQAAEQGHPVAQYNLAATYIANSRSREDRQAAVDWLRQAADHGDVESQYLLANLYASGEGVEKSPPEAMRLWRLAAEQGHHNAQLALADANSSGSVFAIDRMEASRAGRVQSRKQQAAARRIQGSQPAAPSSPTPPPVEEDVQLAQVQSPTIQPGAGVWQDPPQAGARHVATAVDAPPPQPAPAEKVQPTVSTASALPSIASEAPSSSPEVRRPASVAVAAATVPTVVASRRPVGAAVDGIRAGKTKPPETIVAARSTRKETARTSARDADKPSPRPDFRVARIDPRPAIAAVNAKAAAQPSPIRSSVRVALPAPRSQVVKVAEVKPPPAPLPSRPKSSAVPRR